MSNKLTKKVIYTCITDRYDELVDHSFVHPNWDYVCFSDTTIPDDYNRSWQIRPLRYAKLDPAKNNRWHKINPHLILSKYRYSLYVDANLEITSQKFFDYIDNTVKFAATKHPVRKCAYKEQKICTKLKKDDPEIMEKLTTKMSAAGFPTDYGLYANGILLRQHMNKKVIKVMQAWWQIVRTYTVRDQISLPYALWMKKYEIQELNFTIQNCRQLKYWPHSKDNRAHINYLENQNVAYKKYARAIAKEHRKMSKELKKIEATKSHKLVTFVNKHFLHR